MINLELKPRTKYEKNLYLAHAIDTIANNLINNISFYQEQCAATLESEIRQVEERIEKDPDYEINYAYINSDWASQDYLKMSAMKEVYEKLLKALDKELPF